jgi:hypothetical protein
MFAVRGEYTVEAGEVDPRHGYQGRQAGQEVEWFDKIAGSDFEQPQAGPKGGGQDARSPVDSGSATETHASTVNAPERSRAAESATSTQLEGAIAKP